MKQILFLIVAICWNYTSAEATTFGYSLRQCREKMRANPPQIDVVYSYGSLQLDNSKDTAGIQEIFKEINPSHPVQKINGLTTLSPYAQLDNSVVTDIAGERLCYYPQRIQINIGYRPVVYISKDIIKDSCRFSLTIRHEQTHLDIGHLCLQNFANKLKTQFADIVEDIGPVVKSKTDKIEEPDAVAKAMNEAYHAQLKILFDEFVQELLQENARIDTKENYDEEQKLCPRN